MTKKKLTRKEAQEIFKKMIPHFEAIQDILEDHNVEDLCSVTLGGDGYTAGSIFNNGCEIGRLNRERDFTVKMEYSINEDEQEASA